MNGSSESLKSTSKNLEMGHEGIINDVKEDNLIYYLRSLKYRNAFSNFVKYNKKTLWAMEVVEGWQS